jgi:hypothetical protein
VNKFYSLILAALLLCGFAFAQQAKDTGKRLDQLEAKLKTKYGAAILSTAKDYKTGVLAVEFDDAAMSKLTGIPAEDDSQPSGGATFAPPMPMPATHTYQQPQHPRSLPNDFWRPAPPPPPPPYKPAVDTVKPLIETFRCTQGPHNERMIYFKVHTPAPPPPPMPHK